MMSAQNLAKFQAYLKGFAGMQTDAAKLVPLLAQAMHMTPRAGAETDGDAAAVDGGDAAEPAGDAARLRRPARNDAAERRHLQPGAGRARPLQAARARRCRRNVDNYKQVNSLPDFRLFTVFFVVPGALLILLAGYGLFGSPLAAGSRSHHARPTPDRRQ